MESPLDRHDYDALVGFLTRRTRDPHLAEDLAQDTLVRLLDFMKRDTVRQPRALAFRIAENLMRNALKRAGRQATLALVENTVDDQPCIEQTMIDRERLALVQAAIGRLPAKRREVLIRRRLHGQSHREIANAMGISTASVEKHIVRAIASLRAELDETAQERGAL